jgi:dimethylargininase
MLLGMTHRVPESISRCELTFLDRQPIDYRLAVEQHSRYVDALRSEGIKVVELSVNLEFPDACFIEDTAVVVDELAVMTRPGAASRVREVDGIRPELAQYRRIVHIEGPATLEGGDVLRINKRVFVGRSSRTNGEGIRALESFLAPYGYEVVAVTVRDCLHLKSACTAIDDRTLLVNPNWVDLDPFNGYEILSVVDDEPLAANALRVGEAIYMAAAFPRTAGRVEALGLTVKTLDNSEFLKAEAGLTCSSIIFEVPDR